MSRLNNASATNASISTIEISPPTIFNSSIPSTNKRKSSISSSKSSRTQSFKSAENNGENSFERKTVRNSSKHSKQADNFETIILEGSLPLQRRTTELRESFLKRKTKQYEGDLMFFLLYFYQ